MASDYQYSDPRLLFKLWRELTGEDLLSDLTEIKAPQENSVKGAKRKREQVRKKSKKMRLK